MGSEPPRPPRIGLMVQNFESTSTVGQRLGEGCYVHATRGKPDIIDGRRYHYIDRDRPGRLQSDEIDSLSLDDDVERGM